MSGQRLSARTQIPDEFDGRFERLLTACNAHDEASLARALGIKRQSISPYRQKKQIPHAWIVNICERFGVSVDWVLWGTGTMKASWGDELFTPPGRHISAPVTPVPEAEESEREDTGIKIHEDLTLATEVLESNTAYATALHLNIHSFAKAVRESSRTKQLQDKLISQQQELSAQGEALTAQAQTIQNLQTECFSMRKEVEELKSQLARLLSVGDHCEQKQTA